MALIADILLAAGAIGAGIYCFVLARRLAKFTDLDNGMGSAVAVLSQQVDALEKVLQGAQSRATEGKESLKDLTEHADSVASRLELLVASMHDLPAMEETAGMKPAKPAPPPPVEKAQAEATFVRHNKRRA